jgi:protease I
MAQRRARVSPLKIIQLSAPKLTGSVSLEQALARRRSVHDFTGKSLSFTQIGQLAWAGQGITEPEAGLRTAPSTGAIYPISLYFVTQDGLFLYHPDEHTLEEVISEDLRERLAAAAPQQQVVAYAPCCIIIAGSRKKAVPKFGNKAERFMLLEAGHIAQNIHLQAVSLDLGSVSLDTFDTKQARKICKLPAGIEPIHIICAGYPAKKITDETGEQVKEPNDTDGIQSKKAVLIIASRSFRDEELFETQKELEKANVDTVIASTKTGIIKGMLKGRAEAAMLINDIVVDDYDAIIFIGGSGTREYFDNSVALNITRQAARKKKVLAAISIAPAVLARAGVLNGVRATCFSTERLKLKKGGAQYTGADVEQDGLIITANGPRAARQFGKTVANALLETQ